MRGAVTLAAALAIPLTTDAGAPLPGPRPDHLPRVLRRARDARRAGLLAAARDPRARARGRRARREGGGQGADPRGRGGDGAARRAGRRGERARGHRRAAARPVRRSGATASGARFDDGDDGAIEEQSLAYQRVRRELLDAERAAVVALRNEGRIADEVMHRVPARPRPRGLAARRVASAGCTRHGRREERAQVEAHRAVGDPLEVVRELLRHRRLVAAAHLREAGEPRADDEPLPVRRQLRGELLEEARTDRARADERHVAAQDVPELRQLVELRRLQAAADARVLVLGAADELLAEVRAEPRLGVAARACGTCGS